MAKRTSSQVKGDLAELSVMSLLLQHGFAINSLTQSDSGWDLHCHTPDGIYIDASLAPARTSWDLSGRTSHFQVKSGQTGQLSLGTVRGWITGTRSGVPTFMFWRVGDQTVYSSPECISGWLERHADKDDAREVTWSAQGVAAMPYHPYDPVTFSSVVKLWTYYPLIALGLKPLTGWMNGEQVKQRSPVLQLAEDLAISVWATDRVTRYSSENDQLAPLEQLYEAAGVANSTAAAVNYFTSSGYPFSHSDLPAEFSDMHTLAYVYLDLQDVRRSCHSVISDLVDWKEAAPRIPGE